MAKKKEVDGKRLVKMVKEGAAQSDIMKKFGFNTSTQLKLAYAKRGSLILSKELIEELGFKVGDQFLARKTKVGISLKLI